MKDSVIYDGGGMETKAIIESLSTGASVRMFGFRWELEEVTQISDMFDILDGKGKRGLDEIDGRLSVKYKEIKNLMEILSE